MAARGASAAFGGFGFALKTAATFDVFYWLQVTNYGVLYVLFDSAPSGSNYIDVWDLCLHAQTASPIISSQRFSDESRREQAEKLFDRVHDLMRTNRSPFFEICRVLVRLDNVAGFIENANHGIV